MSSLGTSTQSKLIQIEGSVNFLRDQLDLERIPVSEAANSLINYTRVTKDNLLDSYMKGGGGDNSNKNKPRDIEVTSGGHHDGGGCCIIS
ncbi:hypothetical protein CONCODRAFT_79754 [Conidiobolus coronatus NRRL 28638]|uniref:G protein gamma domain-containing protein n=1 Tax=Conidiobolus coronatus (strain ATCC 28846 / CBS 209.66 / NRRL 28638) TaxID=796925 RepID=A0A137P008_CONC2|nr:hypothetical protein CONCODRAFT_79754 [Conidiobolus coronatus NRRL 28638]|eukprot:KXN68395.1 hypothetical protein CONCODRAFT_79754 [Conidiobolus coronatus NRRL 28638]